MNQAQRDELLTRLDERTTQIHRVLFGNGQPGLAQEFEHVRQVQEGCPARRRNWWNIATAVATILAAGAAWLAVLLSSHGV